jgi:hypothetical protein
MPNNFTAPEVQNQFGELTEGRTCIAAGYQLPLRRRFSFQFISKAPYETNTIPLLTFQRAQQRLATHN